MLNRLSLLLICLFAFHFSKAEAHNYSSAQAVVVSHYGKYANGQPKKYILLGLTKKGTLSGFGGLRDPGEKNPKDTAAREVWEESLGVFGSQQEIRRMLRGKPLVVGLANGHPTYVLPGKFYGDHIGAKFRKKRFGPGSQKLSYSQKEMIDIVAISLADLKAAYAKGGRIQFKDNQGVLRPLRSCTYGNLKAVINNGYL